MGIAESFCQTTVLPDHCFARPLFCQTTDGKDAKTIVFTSFVSNGNGPPNPWNPPEFEKNLTSPRIFHRGSFTEDLLKEFLGQISQIMLHEVWFASRTHQVAKIAVVGRLDGENFRMVTEHR